MMGLLDSDPMEDDVERFLGKLAGAFNRIKNLAAATDADSSTTFIRALKVRNKTKIKQMVESGFNVNAIDAGGDRPLHHASRIGDVSMLLLLLELGANPQLGQRDNPEFLPIDDAVAFGHAKAVETLARHGGYLDTRHSNRKLGIIHVACEKGKNKIVKSLVDAGVDANEETPNGSTPLLVATFRAESEVALDLLLNSDVRRRINLTHNHTDILARNAFHIAAENGLHAVVQEMLHAGADPNKVLSNGMTAFDLALNAGQFETAYLLAVSGLDLNKAKAPASLPLHATCMTTSLRQAEKKGRLAETLIRHGADPDKIDPVTGSTPLILALRSADGMQAFAVLLRMGANPNLCESTGLSPLQIALQMQNTHAEKLLRQSLHDYTSRRKTAGLQGP